MRENLTTEEESLLSSKMAGWNDFGCDFKLRALVSEQDFIDYKKLKNGLDLLDQLDRPVAPSFNTLYKQHTSKRETLKTHKQALNGGFL